MKKLITKVDSSTSDGTNADSDTLLIVGSSSHNSSKPNVISRFSLWWIRMFKVISKQRAKDLGLRHWRNVYGDEINHINCRSIWFDNRSRQYRVSHLEDVC